MIEFDNLSADKIDIESKYSNDMLTPDKIMLDLEFLNSPAKDIIDENSKINNDLQNSNEVMTHEVSSSYFKLDYGNNDFESVLKIPMVCKNPRESLMKASLKNAKPFFPKTKSKTKVLVNNENENNQNQDQKQSIHFNINVKCTSMNKFTCRYEIQIPNENGFKVAKRIIGYKGMNMKRIIEMCNMQLNISGHGVKLRLRGKGSGFIEKPDDKESDEDLHLCVSSKFPEFRCKEMDSFKMNLPLFGEMTTETQKFPHNSDLKPYHKQNISMAYEVFKFACRSIETLLIGIYKDYDKYMCQKFGKHSNLKIKKSFNNPAMLMSQMDNFNDMDDYL